MSSPVGHALGATIVYAASSKIMHLPRLSRWHYFGLTLLAWLPDIDVALLSSLSHRGATHGILATLLISPLFYLLFWSAGGTNVLPSRLAVCSVLCAVAHPIMDMLACPARSVHWLAPFRYSDQSIDPFWTVLPQPYFYIVGGNNFHLPWSAIVENIPQIICEILILSGILGSLILSRREGRNWIVLYLPIMIAGLSWMCWRLFFPTVWMR